MTDLNEIMLHKLSDADIRMIFTSVAQGVGNHGSFLTNLSKTAMSADIINFTLMREFLLIMILKYKLYLPEYSPE